MTRHARPALRILTLLFVVVFLSHSSVALAQCELYEVAKLTAPDAAASDLFGLSVSVSGNIAVLGAYQDDCAAGTDCGSAYVYRFNGSSWVQQANLTASDAAQNDRFGLSVSVSGNTAVVGAYQDDCVAGTDCGSAYVYRFNGSSWVQQAKFTASDAAQNDRFGYSVSVSGDVAIVGASYDDCAAGADCGSAYVFRFNGSTWVEEQKLTASDAALGDNFGVSVSVSGDVAVVGAYFGGCCGSAYVFRFNGSTWVEEQKLTAPDAAAYDYFGVSVSVSGDTALVGAYGDDCAAGADCGSAYVYRFNGSTWVEQAKLTAPDAAAFDYFGVSVSVSGDVAVVGAHYDDCAAVVDCGAAYVYRFNGNAWVQERKLTASDAAASDYFGYSVSVSGDVAVVGASYDDCAAGGNCGSAYVFALGNLPLLPDCNANGIPDPCEPDSDCNGNGTHDSCDIGSGTSEDCNSNSVPDECEIARGSSTDANANGIPDECDTNLPPFIIEQPVDQTACEGETAAFTIRAGGMPPFTYQWRKDGFDLPGETGDFLTLASVSPTDDGEYDVVVTNSLGSATSNTATLALVSAAQLEITPDPTGVPKNRYLSFIPSPIPCTTAIRVRLLSLQHPVPPNDPPYPPPNFGPYESGTCTAAGEANGCARWVGKPGTFFEEQYRPGLGSFRGARLQCTPNYRDWSGEGLIHVTGAEIVPSSTYTVEMVDDACMGIEDNCDAVSTPLTITTARSGDVATPFQGPSPAPLTQPNVLDILQSVYKFAGVTGAPVKVIAQLHPNLPEPNTDINALDVVAVVDGVKGKAYAYSGPCPCPSTVPCGPGTGSVPCPGGVFTPCVTAFGAGAMCVRTCTGGSNAGDPCIRNSNCPGGGICDKECVGGANIGLPCGYNDQCPGSTCAVVVDTAFCHDRCGRCN